MTSKPTMQPHPAPPSLYPSLNPHADLLFSPASHWQWPAHRPAAAGRKSKPVPSLKKDILEWFNRLSEDEKRAACAVCNAPFVEELMRAVPLRSCNAVFCFYPLRVAASREGDDVNFQEIMGSIRLGWAGEGVLFLPDSLHHLLGWLERVSGGKVFETARPQVDQNPLWFSSRTFHPLSQWLAREFEMSIVRSYFGSPSPYLEVTFFEEFLKKTGKTSLVRMLSVGLMEWASKGAEERETVREKLRSAEEKLQRAREEELLESLESRPKKSRKRHKRRELPVQQDLQLILLSRQPMQSDSDQEPLSPPIPTPDAQTFQPLDQQPPSLRTEPLKLIQEQIKLTHEENSTDEDRHHLPADPLSEQHQLTIDPCTAATTCTSQAEVKGKTGRKSRAERRAKKEEEALRQSTDMLFRKVVERQLEELVDELSADSNSQLPAKTVAFERVRVLVQSLFPYASALLFGSNAIGLALPTSDIDILLCGLPAASREDSAAYLERISHQFSVMGWVISCRVYGHAKVPVLKLEVDCGVEFLTTRGECSFAVYDPLLIAGLSGGQKGSMRVRVDVSVNSEGGSAGYESTLLMRSWMERLPYLQKLLILFKYLLSLKGLNQNFRGGIGSYCLFVMVGAYLQSEAKPGCLWEGLEGVVSFYQQFDNVGQVICLQEGRCFYPLEEVNCSSKPALLRIIDPITSQLMSSSCHQYQNILAELKRVLQGVRSLQQVVEQEVRVVREQRGKEAVAMLPKLGFLRDFQQKYGNIVKQIFEDRL